MSAKSKLDRAQTLEDVLKTKPNGEELLVELAQIRQNGISFLAKITETFQEFTIHDIRHSDRVISILNWLMVDQLKNALNQYEIFFLLGASILHDIGMANLPALLHDDKEFQSFMIKKKALGLGNDEIVRDYIRSAHHLRSERFINEKYGDLNIKNGVQAQIIGRICRGHRDNLTNRDLYDNRTMYLSHSVNVPLLAALLQIADELDLDFERAPMTLFNNFEIRNPLSKVEWEKNLSVTGIGPNVDDPLSIFVNVTCKNEKVHRALKRMEARVQQMLALLPDHLHQHKDLRFAIPQMICVEIEQIGYKVYDLKFTLQEREIFELLMGKRLYDKETACLRELLQNAIDASRRRRSHEATYKPEISFVVDNASRTIVVSDNGIGMNEYVVKNYFAKIGLSFYRSAEFLEEDCNFTPISQFGIGLLSCFMMANRVIMDTKMDGCEPLRIEMTPLFDYIAVKAGDRRTSGTTVTLYLKDEIDIDSIDFKAEIRSYARHVEIPIRIQISKVQGKKTYG
jgi:molecular chaperone HtpG